MSKPVAVRKPGRGRPATRVSIHARAAGDFRTFYQKSVGSLAEDALHGVPASELVRVGRAMDRSNEYIFRVLGFSPATVKRKLQKAEKMSPEQSERLLGLERIIGLVEAVVAESGATVEPFDAPGWVAGWLDRPCPALGNKRPAEYMGTRMGQEVIEGILAQMQSGAYA